MSFFLPRGSQTGVSGVPQDRSAPAQTPLRGSSGAAGPTGAAKGAHRSERPQHGGRAIGCTNPGCICHHANHPACWEFVTDEPNDRWCFRCGWNEPAHPGGDPNPMPKFSIFRRKP